MDSPLSLSDIKQELVISGIPANLLTVEERIHSDESHVYVKADLHGRDTAFHLARWVYLVAGNSLFTPVVEDITTGYTISSGKVERALMRTHPIECLPAAALSVYLTYHNITTHEAEVAIDGSYPCDEQNTELEITMSAPGTDISQPETRFEEAISPPTFNKSSDRTATITVAKARDVIYRETRSRLQKLTRNQPTFSDSKSQQRTHS